MKEQFKKHAKDTGSVEMQVAALTEHIELLSDHFSKNPKDFSSKRGLIKMVSKRRKFLKYLEKKNQDAYNKLMAHIKEEV
jgi:small subunit ribosomal protein S15